MFDLADDSIGQANSGETRRDLAILASEVGGATGIAGEVSACVDAMRRPRDILAALTTEVGTAPVAVGLRRTVAWRGDQVFIDHRTESEIKSRRPIDVSQLPDPQPDSTRVKRPDRLAVSDGRAPYGHWVCLRHGSTYDPPGRILQRPSPLNLAAPPCNFTGAITIKIG